MKLWKELVVYLKEKIFQMNFNCLIVLIFFIIYYSWNFSINFQREIPKLFYIS